MATSQVESYTHTILVLLSLSLLTPGCSVCISQVEDADNDGLLCEDELLAETDPQVADSDGDGYRDGDEINAGSDPNDSSSVIYTGGWPYNPNKESIDFPAWETESEEGAFLPRFTGIDQYGEIVDMYDFSGQGRRTILDMGTIWCEPCKGMAAYLSDGDTSHVEEYAWWDSDYEGLYEAVRDGDLYWVTVLFSAGGAGDADLSHTQQWHEEFPNDVIPVLADTDLLLYNWIGVGSYPVLNLLADEFSLEIYDDSGPYSVLRELPDIL